MASFPGQHLRLRGLELHFLLLPNCILLHKYTVFYLFFIYIYLILQNRPKITLLGYLCDDHAGAVAVGVTVSDTQS